jgi:hypothetical protein
MPSFALMLFLHPMDHVALYPSVLRKVVDLSNTLGVLQLSGSGSGWVLRNTL